MTVIKEFFMTRKDGVELYKSFSDKKVYIQKQGTDEIYTEAIDVKDAPFIYTETELIIEESDVLEEKEEEQNTDVLI